MTLATTEHHTPVVAGSTGANLIREAALVMVDAHKLAQAVCSTQMVPKHFQGKPDECAAAMLYGASLGFDPMQSVRQIYVVHGQAALYSRAMDALVKGNGHETWTVATSDESVTVAGRRKGSERTEESTWTYERAKKAGYTNNEKYRTDPQAMLYSKALSEVCRKIAPDVLNGVYSVEEMQMERVTVEQVGGGLAAVLAPQTSGPEVSQEPSSLTGSVAHPAVGDVSDPGPEPAPAGESNWPAPDDGSPMLSNRTNFGKAFYARMSERNFASDQERLEYVVETIGRFVESTKLITENEARKVLARLDEEEGIAQAEVVPDA